MTFLYPDLLRRRGGGRKPEKRENCTFDTCVAVGRSSFAKWRVPLPLVWPFVSVASFSAKRAAVFKLEPVIASYFIPAASKQWRRLDRIAESISGRASVKALEEGGNRALSSTAIRIAGYVIRPHSSVLSRDPTKCPIINEALQFDSGFLRLERLS